MFTNDADQPVTDKDLQMELTKTGYLIQSAYSYLKVYQDNNATIGLPMVNLTPLLCWCTSSSACLRAWLRLTPFFIRHFRSSAAGERCLRRKTSYRACAY